jgi:predicted amidohydrolase
MPSFLLAGLLVLAAVVAPLRAGETGAKDGWQFVTVRDETANRGSVQERDGTYALVISGNGTDISDGRWAKRVPLPQGASHVRLTARFRARAIESAARNVLATVAWMDDRGKEVANADFASTTAPPDAQGWRAVDAVFPVPPKATQALVELRLRWSANGQVEWRDAHLAAAPPPAPRKVKVASVNHRPRGTRSARENLEQFARLIDEAGAHQADIVCLPEGITVIGHGSDYLGAAEAVPGPSTDFLGRCAARNHLYVVAGLYERDGKAAYNTAVLIGRDGKLVGKYRKVCLPRGEIDGGLAPGRAYPVFQTDIGRIGMMICWDVSYPEVARELARGGAEMIFMPIWGGNETLCRARAIENQVPLVISSYDLRSAVYDQAGEPKAQAKDASTCVVYADLDLAEPMNWKWTGHWRDRIWIEGPSRADQPGDPVAAQTKAE